MTEWTEIKELAVRKGGESFSEQIDRVSAAFSGKPYVVGPLPAYEESEKLCVDFEAFDCVTYIETVLSICGSESEEGFLKRLADIRYAADNVGWLERNHYLTDWIINNEKKGYVKNITPLQGSCVLTRTLSALENYPAKQQKLCFLNIDCIGSFRGNIETGDIVCFGTERENLDFAHVGFLIAGVEGLRVRHSAKSQKRVCEESLEDFFDRFGGSPGVVIVRPLAKG